MTELVPVEEVITVTIDDIALAWGRTKGRVVATLSRAGIVSVGSNAAGQDVYDWAQVQQVAPRGEVSAGRAELVVPHPRRTYPQQGRTLDPGVLELVFESVPEQTRVAYGKMWKKFLLWCEQHKRCPYPCTGEDLANFVNYLIRTPTQRGKQIAPSSLEIAMAAIRTYHRLHAARSGDTDVQPPDSFLAGKAMKAYKQRWLKAGNRQQASLPLTYREIKQIMPTFDLGTLVGVRNKAVFLLGHGHNSRRTELCTLDIGDITFTEYGMDVYLAMSKTDQAGRGALTPLPFGSSPETCRVQAVRDLIDLLAQHGITSGPLVRPVDLAGKRFAGEPGVTAENWGARRGGSDGGYRLRMTGKGIESIIAKHVKAAGLKGRYTPHGLRSGGLSDRAEGGADEIELTDAGRYATNSTMPRRYVRRHRQAQVNSLRNINL